MRLVDDLFIHFSIEGGGFILKEQVRFDIEMMILQ